MRVVATVAGACVGVALAAGCSALCSSSSTLTPGVYVVDPDASSDTFRADGYELELSEDQATLVEHFSVGGHEYVLSYDVVARTRS